jgi:hypothetical protein
MLAENCGPAIYNLVSHPAVAYDTLYFFHKFTTCFNIHVGCNGDKHRTNNLITLKINAFWLDKSALLQVIMDWHIWVGKVAGCDLDYRGLIPSSDRILFCLLHPEWLWASNCRVSDKGSYFSGLNG